MARRTNFSCRRRYLEDACHAHQTDRLPLDVYVRQLTEILSLPDIGGSQHPLSYDDVSTFAVPLRLIFGECWRGSPPRAAGTASLLRPVVADLRSHAIDRAHRYSVTQWVGGG